MDTSKKCRVFLSGLGGYGQQYVRVILNHLEDWNLEIAAAVDPRPESCLHLKRLLRNDAPIYTDFDEAISKTSFDAAFISSPIQFHASQVQKLMARGADVLSEKPLCATVAEADSMIQAQKQYGKLAWVGYQWSVSDTITQLKADMIKGEFGKLLKMKALVLWPRTRRYYQRNSWAGAKIKNGIEIHDSPVNNATAHYLHNMFYLAGQKPGSSDFPIELTGECYRANKIDNFDCGTLRCRTQGGVEILFYSARPVEHVVGPINRFQFEKAELQSDSDGRFIVRLNDGTEKDYGIPDENPETKIQTFIEAVRSGTPSPCDFLAASAHTRAVKALSESFPEPKDFPHDRIRISVTDDQPLTYVTGLTTDLQKCFEQEKLPSEMGYSWAQAGQKINIGTPIT